MNLPLPQTIWTTGTTEVIKTGTWRASLPHYIDAPAPCHQACPVDGDIAGRICHHPCESDCNRGAYDDPLAICKLERMVGDMALQQGWTFARPEVELP